MSREARSKRRVRGHGRQGAGGHRALRCLVVWLCVTAAVALDTLVIRDELAAALSGDWSGLAFDRLLVRGTAAVAAAAGTWIWLVTTITVVEAAGGLERPDVAAGPIRRLVLAACGVALLSGAVSSPAGATPGHADRADEPTSSVRGQLLSGLPLPDRASIDDAPGRSSPAEQAAPAPAPADPPRARPVAQPATQDAFVVVRAGDSLWSIAVATLPPGADENQVDHRWREIYAENRAVIGADPDLVQPGLRLTLPRT